MATVWFAIVLLCLVMYVTLDGYDLGIGSLLLLERDPGQRREMVNIVATAWDGNESWLILFGVTLWAGLPGMYSVVLPDLYVPLVVMLLALVVRGVAIEMASASSAVPRAWGLLFGVGSVVAAFSQGVAVGGLLSGVTVRDGAFAGRTFDFLDAYSMLTGLATVLLYALAGAAFLRLKTLGSFRVRTGAVGRVLVGLTVAVTVVVALSIPATQASLRLGSPGRVVLFTGLVLVAAAGLVVAWTGFGDRPDRWPVTGIAVAEVAGLLALVSAVFPVVVPPHLTIDQVKSPGSTFVFLLIGVGLNIPLLLFYSWYSHRVFRGKYQVPPEELVDGVSAATQTLLPSRPDQLAPSAGVNR